MENKQTVGWIGIGVMGLSMCRRLLADGYGLCIYTRTQERAQPLLDEGAQWCATPADVARAADTIFTMVGFPADVEQVYFGQDGVFEGLAPGALMIDMTTTKPSLAERIYQGGQSVGAEFVDAPVSGGDVGARNGTLSIMIGGSQHAVARAMPFFQAMGKNLVHQGPAGAGQHTKMCNQITTSGTMGKIP